MTLKHLFGPVSGDFSEQYLYRQRAEGSCRSFGPDQADVPFAPGDNWAELMGRLPGDWKPDLLVLYLPYRQISADLWTAPIPIVGLAGDWNLYWHALRPVLPLCDLILTDPLGVETMQREGARQAREANLFGLGRDMADAEWPDQRRDIDVLFVGNFHPAVQRERLPLLARLANLQDRWNVCLRSGTFGAEYRALLSRARVVFNRSIRSECNMRAFEAVAAGALLFQEAGNREAPRYLRDREECVYYGDDELEELLERHLTNEVERERLVANARRRVSSFSFAQLWKNQLDMIAREWPLLQERQQQRQTQARWPDVWGRVWAAISATSGPDLALRQELTEAVNQSPRDAGILSAFGVVAATRARSSQDAQALVAAANAFQDAWGADPRHVIAGLNLTEALISLGQPEHAMEQARRTLAMLDRLPRLPRKALDAARYPAGYDLFRVEWERAAWTHPGAENAEAVAKETLIRWRLLTILGELTDDPVHYGAACLLRPDLPASRAALGCALARKERFAEAVPELRAAVAGNPFDRNTARALYEALSRLGETAARQEFAAQRQRLAAVAPGLIPLEPWFSPAEQTPHSAADATRKLHIRWQGEQTALHSLALVNRELCSRLIQRGHDVCLLPSTSGQQGAASTPAGLESDSGAVDVHVTHQWPPDFNRPAAGRWLIIQPWEFGSIPRYWLAPLAQQIDEVWVPSSFVRDCFIRDGVPAAKVHVVPNGVADVYLRDAIAPLPLKTRKAFKFLFIGGTIRRKGIDLLLKAYRQAFSAVDDVCLVIKDMGVGTFYRGQTAEEPIASQRAARDAPEIEYISEELNPEQMAGLYAACDCLVHPYRGEGFGLPIAEAMGTGLPVIVTGFGAALDFCDAERAYLIPARPVAFRDKRVADMETVDFPFLAEPDQDALRALLRHVHEHPHEARARGRVARAFIRARFTWDHAAAIAEQRLEAVCDCPASRLESSAPLTSVAANYAGQRRVSLTMIVRNEEHNLAACLESVRGLVAEMLVVDTGSTDTTVDIARRLGARLVHFPWVDSFAAARNESLRHASGDWIFWMDADDRLDEPNRQKLRSLFRQLPDERVGYVMKCLCLPDVETGSATVVDHVRLFRNVPGIQWRYRIHEQILPSLRQLGGDVRWSEVAIQHVGYQDRALRQRKLNRDLRLLLLEDQEHPDDPFTLFNLALVYHEQGKLAEALPLLQRSVSRSHPTDSIVRKLYAMIAQCHRQLGKPADGLASCQQGRRHYPSDPELLFQESLARRELKDLAGAEQCLLQVINGKAEKHFASVDTGLRGYKARHNLAVVCREQGREVDAESHWRAALAERADFIPAQLGLADILLAQGRIAEVNALVTALANDPRGHVEAEVLRARQEIVRGDLAAARAILTRLVENHPQATSPRVFLNRLLQDQGNPPTERSQRD